MKNDAFHMLNQEIKAIKHKIPLSNYQNLKELAILTYKQGEILGEKYQLEKTIERLKEIKCIA